MTRHLAREAVLLEWLRAHGVYGDQFVQDVFSDLTLIKKLRVEGEIAEDDLLQAQAHAFGVEVATIIDLDSLSLEIFRELPEPVSRAHGVIVIDRDRELVLVTDDLTQDEGALVRLLGQRPIRWQVASSATIRRLLKQYQNLLKQHYEQRLTDHESDFLENLIHHAYYSQARTMELGVNKNQYGYRRDTSDSDGGSDDEEVMVWYRIGGYNYPALALDRGQIEILIDTLALEPEVWTIGDEDIVVERIEDADVEEKPRWQIRSLAAGAQLDGLGFTADDIQTIHKALNRQGLIIVNGSIEFNQVVVDALCAELHPQFSVGRAVEQSTRNLTALSTELDQALRAEDDCLVVALTQTLSALPRLALASQHRLIIVSLPGVNREEMAPWLAGSHALIILPTTDKTGTLRPALSRVY